MPQNPTGFREQLFKAHVFSADLKRRSVRGAAVTGAGQAATFALRFGSTAVLARLLTPEDYGLVAMTAVITGFVGMFKDGGLTTATIQRQEVTHEQISMLFWINVGLGCLIAGTLVGISPWIAQFYSEPRVVGITCGLAMTFVFGGLTVQHQALLCRQMRFPVLALLEIGSTAIGVAVGIAMAIWGLGYWSLVGLAIGTAVANAAGVWLAVPWKPGAPRRGSGAGPLVRFGGDVLQFNTVNYFARQADNLLIGWYWGPVALGLYDKAYSLLMLPIGQINAPLAAVAVPALSRARTDSAQFGRFFLASLQLLGSIAIPMVLAIAIFADAVVLVWLGSGWSESASLFRLLAVAALLRALTNPVGWLLISLGHTRRYQQIGLANSAAIVLAFTAGLPYGAAGVAVSYSAVMCLLTVPTWWFALQGSGVSLHAVFRSMAPPFVASLLAGTVGLLLFRSQAFGITYLGRVALGSVAFASTYIVLLLVVFRRWEFFRRIVSELRASRPNRSDEGLTV